MGYQFSFIIAGETYLGDSVFSAKLHAPLFDRFSVGNACSQELTLEFTPSGAVPEMAEITAYYAASESGSPAWTKIGVYYVDTRATDPTGRIAITAYDSMLKADQPFNLPGDVGAWPRSMQTVVQQIAEAMGVAVDTRTSINPEFMVQYPNDFTMREVLGYIAAANGGNWIITAENELYLVPAFVTGDPAYTIGANALSFRAFNLNPAITRIVLIPDESSDVAYYAGAAGYDLTVICPWATQNIANYLLTLAQNYTYQGFTAEKAAVPIGTERGQLVSINNVVGMVADYALYFTPSGVADVAAPQEEEVNHEYQYTSPIKQYTDREVARAQASLQVGIDQITSQVEGLSGDVSQITQTVDNISLSVTTNSDQSGETTASITLTVGPNQYTGYIKITGNVDVSGQLSAEALYAAFGDVADLSVNRLTTSRRIVKYLANDTTDDNYIDIQGQQLQCIAGVYAGGTAQATNPSGALLYWEADPTDASIGSDGYPYTDGNRIFTTITETQWPVMVYTYTDQVKRSISFEQIGQYYTPVDTFGVGDQSGNRIGQLVKSDTGLTLSYKVADGSEIALTFNDTGYTDITGLRKPTALDFSGWDTGTFTETVDGDVSETYQVTFDSSGNPIVITDSSGHQTTITW